MYIAELPDARNYPSSTGPKESILPYVRGGYDHKCEISNPFLYAALFTLGSCWRLVESDLHDTHDTHKTLHKEFYIQPSPYR